MQKPVTSPVQGVGDRIAGKVGILGLEVGYEKRLGCTRIMGFWRENSWKVFHHSALPCQENEGKSARLSRSAKAQWAEEGENVSFLILSLLTDKKIE